MLAVVAAATWRLRHRDRELVLIRKLIDSSRAPRVSAEDSGRYSTPEELRCLPFGTQASLIWRGEKN